MTLTIQQWHQRYAQQAHWTRNLRDYVYERVGLKNARKILEVGCGTGVILEELESLTSINSYGLDISLEPLSLAKKRILSLLGTQGDAHSLPYPSGSFDISLCHFVLLWISDPLGALKEMVRVTRGKGFVCALAEPDYGGRIDFPEELSQIGAWQTESLREQGANPWIGRKLRSLFSDAGLHQIEVGALGGQWVNNAPQDDFDLEWEVIESDLHDRLEFIRSANQLKALELRSRLEQRRLLYVPTFYAFGQVST